ncbi:NAD(P)-binding domain-containing protein [Dactylosporangium sucinum]|uniref:Pyrroline-5-carboxylate reductase catalytic N-terminal domain-containing protein n=1 Tax=Dactylosporangium sucinum TaxID=1424081 RepID=A0A917U9V5_9ACTN|nr:NAD(P)-binding domain-containing protein [Dactylosporangium sucinum]GGM63256.1 hypothetical protein GCM10007977_076070 [Dactylosporangium sucinum]
MTHTTPTRIAVIGGTGPQGRGLAYRLARAGHSIVLGSRDAARADDAAAQLRQQLAAAEITGAATVVGAFHHLSAPLLLDPEADLSHEDVLVCGDDHAAKELVMGLAVDVTGGRAVDAGRLRLARQLEPLTAVLISVNKRYKTRSGVAITGLTQAPQERVHA